MMWMWVRRGRGGVWRVGVMGEGMRDGEMVMFGGGLCGGEEGEGVVVVVEEEGVGGEVGEMWGGVKMMREEKMRVMNGLEGGEKVVGEEVVGEGLDVGVVGGVRVGVMRVVE